MKKLLAVFLTLTLACVLFTGCSKNSTPAAEPTPNNNIDTSEPSNNPDPSKPADTTPSSTSTPDPSPDDTDTIPDPNDISTMPDNLIDVPIPALYNVRGQLGSTPGDIIKTTESPEYYCTISFPIIPDSLKEFADNHGYHYFMIYVESKTDDRSGVILVLYEGGANIVYTDQDGHFGVIAKTYYTFTSSNGAFWRDTVYNAGATVKDNKFGEIPYNERDGDTILDPYTSTSMTPSEQHIEAMIAAIS